MKCEKSKGISAIWENGHTLKTLPECQEQINFIYWFALLGPIQLDGPSIVYLLRLLKKTLRKLLNNSDFLTHLISDALMRFLLGFSATVS